MHAVLIFTGDILVLYALLGALAWPLRHAPARRLVAVALAMIPAALLGLVLLAILLGTGLPEPDYTAMSVGYWEATRRRAADWPPTFLFLLLFQGPLAFGAILSGLAAAKRGAAGVGPGVSVAFAVGTDPEPGGRPCAAG